MANNISSTAIVESGAVVPDSAKIGDFAFVGKNVRLGEGVQIGRYASVSGHTTIGAETKIYSFATVGCEPQDLKYNDEPTRLEIGEKNTIREYVNISTGTVQDQGLTKIGDNNLFMVFTHIAHDCVIGNNCIFANSANIAGHVVVGDYVATGGVVGIHQFCHLGSHAMVAGGSMVAQDVAPFTMVHGNRAKTRGLNVVGLKRSNYTQEEKNSIKEIYRYLFKEQNLFEQSLKNIKANIPDSKVKDIYLDFFSESVRGLC